MNTNHTFPTASAHTPDPHMQSDIDAQPNKSHQRARSKKSECAREFDARYEYDIAYEGGESCGNDEIYHDSEEEDESSSEGSDRDLDGSYDAGYDSSYVSDDDEGSEEYDSNGANDASSEKGSGSDPDLDDDTDHLLPAISEEFGQMKLEHYDAQKGLMTRSIRDSTTPTPTSTPSTSPTADGVMEIGVLRASDTTPSSLGAPLPYSLDEQREFTVLVTDEVDKQTATTTAAAVILTDPTPPSSTAKSMSKTSRFKVLVTKVAASNKFNRSSSSPADLAISPQPVTPSTNVKKVLITTALTTAGKAAGKSFVGEDVIAAFDKNSGAKKGKIKKGVAIAGAVKSRMTPTGLAAGIAGAVVAGGIEGGKVIYEGVEIEGGRFVVKGVVEGEKVVVEAVEVEGKVVGKG